MATTLPQFPKFDLSEEPGTLGPRWKKYVARFRNLVIALNIKDKLRQRALLLHYVGEEVNDIFDILPNTAPEGDESPLDKAIDALTAYFEPKKNVAYEEYQFRQAQQEKEENIMTFYTRLKHLAETCEFTDVSREIKSQIIQHCSSTKLRRKALSNPSMSLDELLNHGKTMELTETQVASLEKQPTQVVNSLTRDTLSRRKGRNYTPKQQYNGTTSSHASTSTKCRNCGGNYPHQGDKTTCPAHGKQCRKCGKMNHFEAVCRSAPKSRARPKPWQQRTKIHNLHEENSSDDEDIFSINVHDIKRNKTKHPFFEVQINDTWITMMADSGSTITLIDEEDFKKLKPRPKLEATTARVYPYKAEEQLPMLGKFKASIGTTGTTKCEEVVYVAEGTGGSLLSWRASQVLDLIKIASTLASDTQTSRVDQLVQEYDDLFHGLGKLKDCQVKLHINEDVQPVAQPHRRVPFHVRQQLEEQLEKDEQQGVIERVDGPTPWVSPVVVVPKPKQPGKIRMCVDMRQANQAIQRERHITPTIKEVIGDLNGAKFFSKLDLNQGYNQLELAPESRYITTFSTHVGLRRFTRLNFGVSSAAEIFQNAISEALSGIEGAVNISDDILIYGKTQEEHDKALEATFKRLRELCLTLHKQKCIYSKTELEFYGYIFSDQGMLPDPKKIEEIVNLAAPTNSSEVRSLLGMANYCSRFIQSYATITQPLRELTQKNRQWAWTPRHDQALAQLKEALTNAPVTAYFDPSKTTEITVDASPVGLGAILTQTDPDNGDRHVITYASRALSETEGRYSQTEREALAVVWGCEYFHLYVYGKPVCVYTDHKPLVAIYTNPKSKPPARIERWALRLQPYQVTVVYKRGIDNPADYMSRHPAKQTTTTSRQERVAEQYINYIVSMATPKALKLQELELETQQDPTLLAVSEAMHTGNWIEAAKRPSINLTTYKAMQQVKDELTLCTSFQIILRGTRIVIPEKLQQRVVDLAHEGHQGIVKTKALLREKVWYSGINKSTEKKVKSCLACQAATPEPKREPLKMSPLPDSPWQEISVDFKELSTGGYLLVVTDDYSRYPAVDVVRTTSGKVVIPHLDKIFAEFGVPEVVRSDNGPPFNGNDFKLFADTLGFAHRKVTPLWPRSNGEVERFMRTLKKAIEAAKTEGKPWKEELCKLLRNYRTTPHSTTGKAPATALFNRSMRTKLPEVPCTQVDPADIRWQDQQAKRRMKEYADRKAYVKPSNIDTGDTVLVRRDPSHKKSTTPYDPQPYIVTKRKGSMVTATREDKEVTRNSSFFKPIKEEESGESEGEDSRPNIKPMDETTPQRHPQHTRQPPTYLKDYVTH